MKKMLTGNYASAYGAKVSKVKVVSAYPITPQTTIVEKIAEFIANGEFDGKYIRVESEHSAMASCIAAENTGVRTFTATSSHGLALMHEMLHWASGARLPIVMSVVNRSLGPPWSIWSDQQDTISQRDTGWMQIYTENNQEVLDSIIMAYRIAENDIVMLPAMVIEDAFILSHTMEPVDIPDQADVDEFLPDYNPKFKLDVSEPMGFGSLIMPEGPFMEFKYKGHESMNNALKIIDETDILFKKKFGRSYGGTVETYKLDNAKYALVMMGSTASTGKEVVDKMRDEGYEVGLLRIRSFRPFPKDKLRNYLSNMKSIGVFDRSYTFGYGGAVFSEVRNTMYGKNIPIKGYIGGLGGRDVTMNLIEKIFLDVVNMSEKGQDKDYEWVGLNGDKRWSQ
ncbi:MAG: pyruvate ferredoxin oxidoreductase [Thermoplasmata archaeon]|nr:pyruvate ferredoxin oxidoreductase [Thermoplasmata archaeon]